MRKAITLGAWIFVVTMTVFSRIRSCTSLATATSTAAARSNPRRISGLLKAGTKLIPSASSSHKPLTIQLELLIPPHYRSEHFSTAAKTSEDFVEETSRLTRTEVRKMRVAQLRDELTNRGLENQGRKPQLVDRLLEALDQSTATGATTETDTAELELWLQQVQGEEIDSEDIEFLSDTGIPLDPRKTYVVRLRSAPSGKHRLVEGFGIGMTLLEVDSNSPEKLSILQNNQMLLPGKRSPFEADYCALVMAMRYLKSREVQHIIMEIDDLGIVRQLTGQGRIGTGYYQQELHRKALELKESFQSFAVRHSSGDELSEEPPADTELLAKTALAKQLPMESDWKMVDPMTDEPSQSTNSEITSIPISPDLEYLLQFDGGARGNPAGVAGVGMVLFDGEDKQEIWCGWKFLGSGQSNNIAEYLALIEGLECAKKLGVRKIRAEGDSQLIVRQVQGQYQVRKEHLKPLHRRVKELGACFDSFSMGYIPRANNKRADYLANHAMDVQSSSSANEIQ